MKQEPIILDRMTLDSSLYLAEELLNRVGRALEISGIGDVAPSGEVNCRQLAKHLKRVRNAFRRFSGPIPMGRGRNFDQKAET